AWLDHYEIPVENPVTMHALASDPEDKGVVAAGNFRADRQMFLNVLFRQERSASGHLTYQR
ncbi:MAG: hypothetical protein WBR23_00525, partial [Candidatus Dormiibacterota bacterium]